MIGVFDSGLGGLSALSALRRALPRADLVYFGDTARTPYGTRQPHVIRQYAREAVDFLSARGCHTVLSACGTVSAVALKALKAQTDMPLFGIIEPAAEAVLPAKSEKILVLATSATASSHAFRDAILERAPDASVTEFPCPFFVAMVENGLYDPCDPLTAACVRRVLAKQPEAFPDAVLLGCTHFPFLAKSIQKVFPKARLIDAARLSAEALIRALPAKEKEGTGLMEIYVSDSALRFRETASPFWQDFSGATVKEVHIGTI